MTELFRHIWKKVLVVFVFAIAAGFIIAKTTSPEAPVAGNELEEATPAVVVRLLPLGPDPKEVTVARGSIVEFAARDGKLHDLREGEPDLHEAAPSKKEGYQSGVFAPDEAYRVRFDRVGEFVFHDHLNLKTVIYIHVYEPTS
ncbi:MAG: hypothetical protein V4674_02400 [Patescibacteria group bacterium]